MLCNLNLKLMLFGNLGVFLVFVQKNEQYFQTSKFRVELKSVFNEYDRDMFQKVGKSPNHLKMCGILFSREKFINACNPHRLVPRVRK